MNLQRWTGPLVLAASFLMIGIGLFSQIVKNFQDRSVVGLALPMFICSLFLWSSVALHSWLRRDYWVAVPQVIGAVLTAVILLQFIIYPA